MLDIGSVLEVVDDTRWPGPFEQRHGLAPGAVSGVVLAGDALLGEVSEADVRETWRRGLELDEDGAEELMADFWRWYVGELDRELYDWFAAQRPARLTGILSNSAPGAREAERCWGFEAVTDDIVYSHEVGLAKPDPRVYALTEGRLGVRPEEIVFLDDVAGHVEAACRRGWRGVLHVETPRSIADMERFIHAP